MSLLERLGSSKPKASINPLDFDQWLGFFDFNGTGYPFPMVNQTYAGGTTQEILPTFTGLSNSLLARNGIVWACVTTRNMLFAEAMFQFRRKGSVTSGDLYGTTALATLEEPWPGGTTRKLLALMELHVQLAGNAYAFRDPDYANTLRVLRPDWMTIVLGSRTPKADFEVGDPSTEVIGYAYRPGGDKSRETIILPDQMAHFMPHPDPIFPFRGASWIAPVIREVMSDSGMTDHKLRFLENGATPNMVVTLDPRINKNQFDEWVDKFDEGHKGVMNAYKTIYLAGGADAKVVGANLKELDFRAIQAHEETRICNAAGIPPIIVGVSEGLDSATYSNYAQARRAWADSRLRPMWAGVCAELAKLINVPGGSELWYDERRIAFLAEDMQIQATIMSTQATTLAALTNAGWTPESAAAFVESGDLSRLTHTGLYSVQLQPPGTEMSPAQTAPAVAPVALACSLCGEDAGSNAERCRPCAELSTDLRTKPAHVTRRVADQLRLSETDAAIALGLERPEPPRLVLNSKPANFLEPALNSNGRLT